MGLAQEPAEPWRLTRADEWEGQSGLEPTWLWIRTAPPGHLRRDVIAPRVFGGILHMASQDVRWRGVLGLEFAVARVPGMIPDQLQPLAVHSAENRDTTTLRTRRSHARNRCSRASRGVGGGRRCPRRRKGPMWRVRRRARCGAQAQSTRDYAGPTASTMMTPRTRQSPAPSAQEVKKGRAGLARHGKSRRRNEGNTSEADDWQTTYGCNEWAIICHCVNSPVLRVDASVLKGRLPRLQA